MRSATPADVGGGEPNFASLTELSHYYRVNVFVPAGVPISAPTAYRGADGSLLGYGYSVFGGLGSVGVLGPAPASLADYGAASGSDPRHPVIWRRIVNVRGEQAISLKTGLISTQPGTIDTFVLLWQQGGMLLQAIVATVGTGQGLATAGPDTLTALANDMQEFSPDNVDSAGIQTISMEPPLFGHQFAAEHAISDASEAYGGPLIAPAEFTSVTVLHAGVIRSYSVDLDAQGNRRLFLAAAPPPPAASEAAAPNVRATQELSVRAAPALYEQIATAAGTTSLLHFAVGGTQFLLEDATGASAADLVAVAESVAPASGPTSGSPVTGATADTPADAMPMPG